MVINPVYEFIQKDSICDGSIFTWRGNNYTASGTYYDSLQTVLGCDSVYVLNLIFNPTYEFVTNEGICNGDIYTWRGNDYSISGTYYDSLYTFLGCDSVYVLVLNVLTIDVTVTQNGTILSANATGANYQWVDCDNAYAIIPNETNSVFTATANGNYAVIITQNTCVDTSACFNVTGVFTENVKGKEILDIYPNPNNGNFTLYSSENAYIIVHNAIGEIVYQGLIESGTHDFSMNQLANGVYYFNIMGNNMLINKKLVIQK